MSTRTNSVIAAVGLMFAMGQAVAAVPHDSAPVLTIGRSTVDRWAVQPVRGQGWNVPIEGSVIIRPAVFLPWDVQL